jgi:hypothetical protein
MNYSVTDSGLSCTIDSVGLVFDSTAVNPAFVSGGQGLCAGRGRSDTTLIHNGVIDSIAVGGGRIRFRVFGGAWHADGRIISTDSLSGTMTQDGLYVGIGQVHMVGPWGAKRQPPGGP